MRLQNKCKLIRTSVVILSIRSKMFLTKWVHDQLAPKCLIDRPRTYKTTQEYWTKFNSRKGCLLEISHLLLCHYLQTLKLFIKLLIDKANKKEILKRLIRSVSSPLLKKIEFRIIKFLNKEVWLANLL